MHSRLVGDRIARSRKSVLLLGPRQVGKSTACRALNPAFYLDLADQAEFLSYTKDASRLRRELASGPVRGLVVIDEIQRVPGLLNTVQSILDKPGNKLRFVLTGSSARKLKRGGANLLPGRVVLEHMDPLTVLETGPRLDLPRALRLGMLPGIYWGGAEASDVLHAYAEVYLREEIQAEAATKNLGGYARFLDAIAAASGQWLNYSKLASDIEVPKETLRRYVQLLEDTLLAVRIAPYRARAGLSRRVLQRERVLIFDVGVRNALLGLRGRTLTADQTGSGFEQWVILQVCHLGRALKKNWKLSSYRSEAGAEVDLVVEGDFGTVGIEIKHGRNASVRDTRGLVSLAEIVASNRKMRKWIFYRGERRQRFPNGVEAIPVLEGLQALVEL
jgi:predicted AAA+ superfamily ATPase